MSEDPEKSKVEPVSPKELRLIRDALTTKYGGRLQPGESLSVDGERTDEHVSMLVVIEAADDSFRLEVEGASLPADSQEEWRPDERFELVMDLVDAQLAEYFENDRFAKLHDDWRSCEFGGAELRIRGSERRPDLEKLADEWLERGGPPDKSDLN